jgi:hypothetical protein
LPDLKTSGPPKIIKEKIRKATDQDINIDQIWQIDLLLKMFKFTVALLFITDLLLAQSGVINSPSHWNPGTKVVETNGRCGPSHSGKYCRKEHCCSKWGWCGQTDSHCLPNLGCDIRFGICSEATAAKPTPKAENKQPAVTTYSPPKSQPTTEPVLEVKQPEVKQPEVKQTEVKQQPVARTYSTTSTLKYYYYNGGLNTCEEKTHAETDLVVAMSTSMFNWDCRREIRNIEIRAKKTGRTARVAVVDVCNEDHGCAKNVVDGTIGVWAALGLDLSDGVAEIEWVFV